MINFGTMTKHSDQDGRTRPKLAMTIAVRWKVANFRDDGRTRPKLTAADTTYHKNTIFKDDDGRTRPRSMTTDRPYDKRRKKAQRTSAGGKTIKYLPRIVNKVVMNLVGPLSATKMITLLH